uniref:Uncharacterized protein n=2 Tax=viral metagenome TaxID=1070528 RepID=A0A6M3IE51_9ZZZZ
MNIFKKMKLLYNMYELYNLWRKLPMAGFLSSKKAWGLIFGSLMLVLTNVVGLSEQQAAEVMRGLEILAGIYIGSQGAVDVIKMKVEGASK